MLKPREKIVRKSGHEEEKYYLRFSIVKRIEHWVFMASFTTLGLTGLIQKFASSPVSETLIGYVGWDRDHPGHPPDCGHDHDAGGRVSCRGSRIPLVRPA